MSQMTGVNVGVAIVILYSAMPSDFDWRGAHRALVTVLVAVALAGCSAHAASNQDGGGGAAGGGGNGGGSGGGGGGVCGNGDGYHDIGDLPCWTTHDAPAGVSSGSTFDGRYIYFASGLRYDTQASFSDSSAWVHYDFSGGNSTLSGFEGTAFDGRYVYFVPSANSIAARYDTQSDFSTQASWSQFDLSTINSMATGFMGSVFDGRYVYFVSGTGLYFARYDTQVSFTDTTAWTVLLAPTGHPTNLFGGVFDGRYIYCPEFGTTTHDDIAVERYDTQAPIGMGSSWTEFDITKIDSGATGFRGASFDGRYVYLVPTYSLGTFRNDYGIVWRYDTQQVFANASSWSQFDTTQLLATPLATSFSGSMFDGRYVYFVPGKINADQLLLRVDTQADFTAASSWSTFNILSTGAGPEGSTFAGAVFDGRYLYVLPTQDPSIARFDAKTPPALPPLPEFHGSFY